MFGAIDQIGHVVDDLDAALTDAAPRGLMPVILAGDDTMRVAYLANPADPGSLYELIEGAGMRAMIDAGIAEAAGWDGRDPIREIAMPGGAA